MEILDAQVTRVWTGWGDSIRRNTTAKSAASTSGCNAGFSS